MSQSLSAFGLEFLVMVVAATVPFGAAARNGLRATGVGYDRKVTVWQFVAGFGLFIVAIAVLSLLWGVFNTWELIFRVQRLDEP